MFSKLAKCNLPMHCTFKFYLEFISKDVKRVSKKTGSKKRKFNFWHVYVYCRLIFKLLVHFHFTDLDHEHLWHGNTFFFVFFFHFLFTYFHFNKVFL
jgi:hypothetical protein